MTGGRYWENAEDRTCRVCGSEVENCEHVLHRCMDSGLERKEICEQMCDSGEGGSG